MAHVVQRGEWASHPELPVGQWQGGEAGISLIFHTSNGPGHGPNLHTHPYAETFIIQEGRALFTIGEEQIEATAGQIVVAPANTPHGYKGTGPGVFRTINVHASGTFITHWIGEPEPGR